MADKLITFLAGYNVSPTMIIFIISLLPILELRGGLVAAAFLKIPFTTAFPVCVIGNILPVPFILLFIKSIFSFMKKHNILTSLVTWLENKGMSKSDSIQTKKLLGLFAFVAIPLPGTGAWTGSLIASLLNFDNKKSFIAISFGVLGAGVIMSIISYFIPELFGFVFS